MNMFKCLYNFPENVDKNMNLWTTMSKLSGKQYEHSNLLMNIQRNSESMDNYI